MLGGIIVNVFVGVTIFIFLTYIMGETYLPKEYVNNHGGIEALDLAKDIGLKTGDKIVKINGKDYDDFMDVADPDMLLTNNSYYTVLRDGQEINVPIPGNFIEQFNSKEAAEKFVRNRLPATVAKVADEIDNPKGDKVTSMAKELVFSQATSL
ncbi:MAG: hypothetical protein WDO15_22520 [Bacteroidota bacterium]